MSDPQILVAGVGSAADVRTYSGTPHFLLDAAQKIEGQEWVDLGFDVQGSVWVARRYAWNLASLVSGRGKGGYQFTESFLETLWKPAHPMPPGRHVLNWTQLYPPSFVAKDDIWRSFYIDQTLGQLFSGYGVGTAISPHVEQSALHRERTGYARAHAIITTSEWGRRGVLETEPDAKDRAHVVLPGANLPLAPYRSWATMQRLRPCDPSRPLRLLFIGLHPIRKGLDRLLRAMGLAREAGSRIELTVIGSMPHDVEEDLRGTAGVEWVGRIDKIAELPRLLSIAGEHHIGCLLSRVEASAISLREYQAMGLAVLGPDVGGCPELITAGAGALVAPEADDEVIAALLIDLERDRSRVDAMRAAAWDAREDVLWPRAVDRISLILRAPDGQASSDGFV